MLGCGNLNILLRFVKKIYSLPVVYSLKKKENWKNDVSFYKKIIFGIIIMYYYRIRSVNILKNNYIRRIFF